MASSLAYDSPSPTSSWVAFKKNFPAIAAIWSVVVLLYVVDLAVTPIIASLLGRAFGSYESGLLVGNLFSVPFSIINSLVCVMLPVIPAMYFHSGEVVTPGMAFSEIFRRPFRYIFAGFFFGLVTLAGYLLLFFPGMIISFVAPVFINKIFLTDLTIPEAFSSSFQSVYGSENSLSFIATSFFAMTLVIFFSCITCLIGSLIFFPMYYFYIQNYAYYKGILK